MFLKSKKLYIIGALILSVATISEARHGHHRRGGRHVRLRLGGMGMGMHMHGCRGLTGPAQQQCMNNKMERRQMRTVCMQNCMQQMGMPAGRSMPMRTCRRRMGAPAGTFECTTAATATQPAVIETITVTDEEADKAAAEIVEQVIDETEALGGEGKELDVEDDTETPENK